MNSIKPFVKDAFVAIYFIKFARFHKNSLIKIEKTLNRPITKSYKLRVKVNTCFNLQYMFRHSNVFFSFIQNIYTIYKLKCSKNYMVLCNPFPDTSFTVKKN